MLKVLQHNTELALESWLFVFNALFMCTHQRHSIMGQRGFCLHFIIERESISHLVMSTFCDSTDCSPHQVPLTMEFSRQEYIVDCHSLFQGIFLTQGSNPSLLHCRQILYQLSHQGSLNFTQKHFK